MRDLLRSRAPEIGPRLLGSVIKTAFEGAEVSVVITEVEAYTSSDPASHSYRGRTARNASMFGPPGTLYVYRSYGLHWCMNITTGPVDEASALLLRAGVVRTGRETAVRRRGRETHLSDGPGKLTQLLGVTGAHDGADVLDQTGPVVLAPGPALDWTATPRIGITRAVDVPWRWVAVGPVMSPDSELNVQE